MVFENRYNNQMHLNKKTYTLDKSEISLYDAIDFLKKSWKFIVCGTALGLMFSLFYLAIVPKKYQAISTISLAQVVNIESRTSQTVNVEDPVLLVARISSSVIEESNGAQCDSNFSAGEVYTAVPLKGVSNAVVLTAFGSTPAAAKKCAEVAYDFIKKSQEELVSPYLDVINARIAYDKKRLKEMGQEILTADKAGRYNAGTYLVLRDENHFLLTELAFLEGAINLINAKSTRLVAPISVSQTPIEPKKRAVLLAGISLGFLLGFFAALVYSLRIAFNNQPTEVVQSAGNR